MSRSAKNPWLQRQFSDPYVQKARAEGFRSRASFKILDIHRQYRLFRPGQWILELGAAPGGWTQVIRPLLGRHGGLCAVDLLAMAPIPGVHMVQANMEDPLVEAEIAHWLAGRSSGQGVEWILSDMAPSMSGIPVRDQAQMILLNEGVLDCAERYLQRGREGGGMLTKCFHGAGTEAFVAKLKKLFKKVSWIKPKASRAESREIYVLACSYTVE